MLHVSRDPETGIVQTRVIQSRGVECRDRRHQIGLRLYLWEILPDYRYRPTLAWDTPFSA